MAKKRKNKRMRKRLWFTATERVEKRQAHTCELPFLDAHRSPARSA